MRIKRFHIYLYIHIKCIYMYIFVRLLKIIAIGVASAVAMY